MKAKFCLPIVRNSIQKVLEEVQINKDNFDTFEVWVDYFIDDFSVTLEGVRALAEKHQDHLIIVFRQKDGSPIHMPFDKRLKIIAAIEKTKTYVDLDIEKQREDLEKVKNQNIHVQVIASFHDYEKTPQVSNLYNIIQEMSMFNPTIYKIAAFCQTEKQALSLVQLLLDLKEQNKDCIVLGMGRYGKITRVFGSLWGNEMIFAPTQLSEKSASGQLTKKQLEIIFKELERN